MQYKLLCIDNKWLPKESGGIWLWKGTKDGLPKVLCGDPNALKPKKMYGYDKVLKGLERFLNLWNVMSNDDFYGKFKRMIKPVSHNWRDVKATLDLCLPSKENLTNGFWPKIRFIPFEAV